MDADMVPLQAEQPDRPTKSLRENTTMGQKRPLEGVIEERDQPLDNQRDAEMTLLETLAVEAKISETILQEEKEEQIRLENGWQWAPRSWVIKGDVKEMQGLADKHNLKFVSEPPKDARVITSKVVRTFKGDGVKSRLVLRDIESPKPDGGELYARRYE